MKIYTDGATSNNGYSNAIGGWAFVIIDDNEELIYSNFGKVIGATNQQMELMALIEACKCAFMDYEEKIPKNENLFAIDKNKYEFFSDSSYAIECYKQNWWVNWQRNGWLNAKKQPVANQELWKELILYF